MQGKFLFMLLFLPCSVFSQKSKEFYDSYGLQGKINYSGSWSDSTLPKNGAYELSWREINNRQIRSFRASGPLQNNLPSGKWLWEECEWAYTLDVGKTREPLFNLNGEKHSWEGDFKAGKASGIWKFTLDSVPAKKQEKKGNLRISSGFENGNTSGPLSVSDSRFSQNFQATGACDKEGIASGIWIFKYNKGAHQTIETRTYDRGILVEITSLSIEAKDTLKTHQKFEDVQEKLSLLKSATRPLGFQIGDLSFETDGYESEVKTLFLNYLENYFLKGWHLPEFKTQVERRGPVFKKIQYPLTNEEKELRASTLQKIESLAQTLQKRRQYQNIYLNRGRSSQLDAALCFIDLTLIKIQQTDSLLQQSQNPVFTYINRSLPGALNWERLLNKGSIALPEYFPENQVALPAFRFYPEKESVFASLHEFVVHLDSACVTHLNEIDEAYQKLQKEGELLALENALAEKLRLLDSTYAAGSGSAGLVQQQWIKSFIRKEFQVYARGDDYVSSKRLAEELSEKMDSLLIWHKDWALIDSMPASLLDRYSVYEYNPYNGKHDIEIRKKRRFYNKISSVFWPWMMERFNNAQNWEDLVESKRQLEQTYAYLIGFASETDASSRRIEKRIRKEKSPEKILKTVLGHL